MKIYHLFFIFIIDLLSCQTNNIKDTKDNSIIGKWSNCETIISQNNVSTSEHPNVCPIIVFLKDHHGYFKTAGYESPLFTWKTNKDELVIGDAENGKDFLLRNGKYKIIITKEKLYQEIALLDIEKNVKYVLGK